MLISCAGKQKTKQGADRSFNKKTKQGAVCKVVREHKLRDDISCGAPFCKLCNISAAAAAARLSSSLTKLLIVDTNIVLSQIDLLENAAIEDVVILSIVFEEVKNKNLRIYNRLRAVTGNPSRRFFVFSNEHHRDTYVEKMSGESPNDRNDRAIRVAAKWYQSHLGDSVRVLLVTNDRENKRKAIQEGISAMSVESYVKSLDQPELLDLIRAQPDLNASDIVEDLRPAKRRIIYPKHKSSSEIIREGIYHQGRLRVNSHNPYEAYVRSEESGDEIIIYGRVNMNRAFDGDLVAVQLLPRDQWRGEASMAIANEEDREDNVDDMQGYSTSSSRPCGKVVGIMKRNWDYKMYCGSLEPMEMAGGGNGRVVHALFVPKDKRIPKIRVETKQIENLVDKRIVVKVDSWEVNFVNPCGHYVRTIGVIGDKNTETEVLLLENDVEFKPFSAQVLACLPPLPWYVSPEAVADPASRLDLRHLRVFSVDPPGCTDIDDALHCTALPRGNFEVGVHIADVTNFVRPGTPLDSEASRRGTSVYLVDRRIDMPPKPLTEDICSLRADVERLAFSVIWELTPQADIVATRFTKSVIRSCAALSYIEAQERMDNLCFSDPVTTDLRNLNALAKIMRQKRVDRGALTLASPEVKFEIDTSTHDPIDIGMYQIREANIMVEEFMLAANISVSEKILNRFPQCALLRRHPTPTKEMLEPLISTANAVGLNLDTTSSKSLADSLDRAVGNENDPYFNKLIRILATRCMSQAVYFTSKNLNSSEYHHYGLATPLYTHFTSPIRRYADVIVHRLLAASLGISNLPNEFLDFSENLNTRHRNAQMASRASVELHTLIYFKNRPTDAEARILKIRSNGFIVFVPKYGIEGPVCLSKEERWEVDEEGQRIRKSDNSISYGVLQTVQVHIEVAEPQPHRPKLQLKLIV